jgi:hypothetical protein
MIIAICGMKRCGKDTVANRLSTILTTYKHTKIAAPLKDMCGQLFDWSSQQMEDDTKDNVDPRWGISPRKALQFVGTEVMQYKMQELLPDVGRNFWISKLLNSASTTTQNMIISDMRFVHEDEMIKANTESYRSLIIKVTRPCVPSTVLCDHSSEQEWELIKEDVLIVNDGSIDELNAKVDDVITKHLG